MEPVGERPADPVLRIGVTGHRVIAAPDVVAAAVDAALDRVLVEQLGDREAPLEIWSSLADGADRLVVHRVLARPHATLVAVLPLAPDDYRTDFDASSSREFERLLGRATSVHVPGTGPSGTRESAYERAGHAVIDGCDVLLALWDGEPSRGRGGTAEIVDEARRRGREVIVIPVERAA
jgi:hypothetical protein